MKLVTRSLFVLMLLAMGYSGLLRADEDWVLDEEQGACGIRYYRENGYFMTQCEISRDAACTAMWGDPDAEPAYCRGKTHGGSGTPACYYNGLGSPTYTASEPFVCTTDPYGGG